MSKLWDAIVVGGGPAGVTAAIRLARAGLDVIVVEAAIYPGAENWSGAVYFTETLAEPDVLGADELEAAPFERRVVKRGFYVTNGVAIAGAEYQSPETFPNCYTVLRPVYDHYLAERARRFGVAFLNETAACGLIRDRGRIVGVHTTRGPLYGHVVFLAEGDAAELTHKEGMEEGTGRGRRGRPAFLQGVKEVVALDPAVLEQRFGVGAGEGACFEVLLRNAVVEGRPVRLNMAGFLYTNRESVSIGLVLPLENLAHFRGEYNTLMEWFKTLPGIARWIEGGESVSYGAKVIRGGGYREIPRLVDDGLAIGGAATGIGVDFPYPNFTGPATAMGRCFADAVIRMREQGVEPSRTNLEREYVRPLKATRYYKDVRHLADWPRYVETSEAFFGQQIDALLGTLYVWTRPDLSPIRKVWEGARVVGEAFRGRWGRTVWDLHLGSKALRLGRYVVKHLPVAFPLWVVQTLWAPFPVWRGRAKGELRFEFWVQGEPVGRLPAPLRWIGRRLRSAWTRAAHALYANDDRPLGAKLDRAIGIVLRRLTLWEWLLAAFAAATYAVARSLQRLGGLLAAPFRRRSVERRRRTFYGRWVERAREWSDLTPGRVPIARPHDAKLADISYIHEAASHIKVFFPVPEPGRLEDPSHSTLWSVCPAAVYQLNADETRHQAVTVNHENCLKCETCWRVSPDVDWNRFGDQRLIYEVYTSADAALERIGSERTGEPGPEITSDYWSIALAEAPSPSSVAVSADDAARALGAADAALRRVAAKACELHETLRRGPRVLEPGQVAWLEDTADYLRVLCGEVTEALRAGPLNDAMMAAGLGPHVVPLLDDLESVARRVERHAAARRFFFADADAQQIRQHHVVGLRRMLERAAKVAGAEIPATPESLVGEGDPAADALRAACERVRERWAAIFSRERLRKLERGGSLPDEAAAHLRAIARALVAGELWEGCPRDRVLSELARLDPALAWLVANQLAAAAALEVAEAPADLLESVRSAETWLAPALEEAAEPQGERWAGRIPFAPTTLADRFLVRGGGRIAVVRRTGKTVRTEARSPIGLRACGVADLVLDGATPVWEGAWRASADEQLFRVRARDLAAIARGAGDLLAERAIEHAQSRVQFPDHFQDLDGRDAIAKFGAIREHLARIEAHRLTLVTLVEDAAWADQAAAVEPGGDPAGLEPKLAKVAATRAFGPEMDSLAYRTGQVIGGTAYSEDDIFAKLYRDSAVFPQLLRANAALTLDVGRAIAALIRDGRPLGPLASGVATAFETAEHRPILGDLVQRLRAAERAIVEAAAPVLEALEEEGSERGAGGDGSGREAVHWILGEQAVDLYVWERLLDRAHTGLDAGRDSEAWVEAVRLTADTVEEQLVGLEDELAWTPVRLGLGTHGLSLGDYPDAPPHTPIEFSYAKEIRGGRRRYVSGDFLLKPTDLERTPYTPELVFCDPDLRAYYETVLRLCRERFEETDYEGVGFERYLDRLHHIPREHIDWARQHGFFRTVIPAEFGGEGRTKADYYNLCRATRRLGDVALTLTIQANTSIGTAPILIALEEELPVAERELRQALERPELAAGWKRRLERAIERVQDLDVDRVGPELGALDAGTREALARSRVLRRSVFGAFLDRVADATSAWTRRDLASLRRALEAARAALDGWEERAREEAAEILLRHEAHEFFLRLIAARMISAFALTEPSAGSDTARIRTEARLTARTVHTDERGVTFFYVDEERGEGRRNICDLRRFVFEDVKILYRYRDDAPPAEVQSHEYSYEDEEEERYRTYVHDGRRVEIHDVAILRERDDRRVYEFYVLNGAKMWITNGHIAGVMSLYARTPRGPTGFMVDAHAEGFRVGKDEEKMGQRGSSTNEIALTNVRVPRECIIGIEGRGQENALETLNVGRAGLAVTSEAGLDRQLADFRAHLRRSGLAEAAWARYLLGRALEETFVVESIAFRLIALFDDPTTRSLRMESAIAKLFTSESAHRMLRYGEPIYGIAGQTDRHRIEKERRDARVLTIYEGTNEVQRFLIWRDLVETIAPAWTAPSDATPPAGSAFVDEVQWLNEMKRDLRDRVRAVREAYGSAAWQRVLLQPVFFHLADLAVWIAAAEWAIQRAHWLDTSLTSPADAAHREWSGMAAGSFAARARREAARHRFAFDRDWAQVYAGGRPSTLRLAELVLDEADRAHGAEEEPQPVAAAPTRPLRIVVCVDEVPRFAPRPRVRDGRVAEHLYGAAPGSRRALRLALDLKRLAPDRVSVTVIAAAPARAETILRRALAAGADDAWLLDTRGEPYEEHAVSAAIVGALEARGLRPDVVLASTDAPSGGVAPRLAFELGEWTWLPDVHALTVTGATEARAVSDVLVGAALHVPLPVVAEVTARETEPEWAFDVAGYLRALARPVKVLPMPEAGARRDEMLERPAAAFAAEERGVAEAVTPERAAEMLLAAFGLGSRDGGPTPAAYTGKIESSSSRSLEWRGSVLFAAEARDATLTRESTAACAVASAAAAALRLAVDAVVLTPPLSESAIRALAAQLLAAAPFGRVAVIEDAAFESRSARAREHALCEIISAERSAAPRAVVSDARLAKALPGFAARLREAGRAVEEFHGIERLEAERGGGKLVRAVYGRRLRAVRTWSAKDDRIHLLGCAPEVEATGPVPKAGKDAPTVLRVKLAWTYDPARDPIARAAAAPSSAEAPITLQNAEFVIDVGAGVGSGENLERIVEPVRRALLAAGAPHVELGASRKVTEDLSLLPSSRQIGQTGVRINPRALIMLGVSGAPQHLDYIGERPIIIAFNLDPAAPIMTLNERRARPLVVPVVGDLLETVPRFVEALARAAGLRAA